jgi:hypothetical protein
LIYPAVNSPRIFAADLGSVKEDNLPDLAKSADSSVNVRPSGNLVAVESYIYLLFEFSYLSLNK